MKRSWPGTRELCENVPDIGNSPCEERKEKNPNLSRVSEINPSSAARACKTEPAPSPSPGRPRPSPAAAFGHKATFDYTACLQLNTSPRREPGVRWGEGWWDPLSQPWVGKHRILVSSRSGPSPNKSSELPCIFPDVWQ